MTALLPRVSVIVPTYNRASMLLETLSSVCAQTLADLECVVVDDGSTDDTRARCEALAAEDARLRYVWQPNGGSAGRTRNRGVRETSAPLIAFVDDDDLWLADKLARQVGVFDREPDVGLVFGLVERFGDGSGLWPDVPIDERPSFERLLAGNVVPCSTVLVKRDVLERVGLFDESLRIGEDWELWLRIARTFPIRAIREPVARYRVHGSGISHNEEVDIASVERILDRAEHEWHVPQELLSRARRGAHRRRARRAGSLWSALPHWWRAWTS